MIPQSFLEIKQGLFAVASAIEALAIAQNNQAHVQKLAQGVHGGFDFVDVKAFIDENRRKERRK